MKMKNYLPYMLILFLASGCSCHNNLQSDLTGYLGSNNQITAYNACAILGAIKVDEKNIEQIKNISQSSAKTELARICAAYILSKKINESAYNIKFINLFPIGPDSISILKIHEDSGYPISLSSPLVEHLFNLSLENETALRKLATLSNHADGTHGETISTYLSQIYCHTPERIENLSQILENNMHFIKLTAEEICK